jgi:prepilin-type N-terminal cleavage/methylation domain-containing protein
MHRHKPRSGESGFTLLELIIGIVILTIFATIIYPVFTQTAHYAATVSTRARLQELVKGLTVAYQKDAMVIDSTGDNGNVVFNVGGTQVLGAYGDPLGTGVLSNGSVPVTPVQAMTPDKPSTLESGFTAIASAAGNSPLSLAENGDGVPVWVYVSPEIQGAYDGYPVYYHDVAFLSTNGAPANVTPMSQGVTYTCSANATTQSSGCSLNLGTAGGQHDSVATFSGYAIEAAKYQSTLAQMREIADDYQSYFTTQYLANPQRNADIDYFANIDTAWDGCGPSGGGNAYMDTNSLIPNSGDGSNGGPGYAFPGQTPNGNPYAYAITGGTVLNDTQPATWDGDAFTTNLGISVSEATTAWGFLMGVANGPNAPNVNGEIDRDPLSCSANLQSPPYTAYIEAWAPGQVLLSVPVVGTY